MGLEEEVCPASCTGTRQERTLDSSGSLSEVNMAGWSLAKPQQLMTGAKCFQATTLFATATEISGCTYLPVMESLLLYTYFVVSVLQGKDAY